MNIKRIAAIVLVLFGMFSCMDVLDKHDLSTVNDLIWDDQNTAMLYLNKLYDDNMPDMSLGESSGYSDEGFSATESVAKLLYGLVDNTDFSTSYVSRSSDMFHKENFRLIRQINICIDGMKKSTLNDSIKGLIMGQAMFLRAYRYWEIIKLYGGVPMVLHTQDPFMENTHKARNKTSECIDILVADLDYAIQYLPDRWDAANLGRITKGAAAAYKGRVLLNWASPLFNPDNKADRWQRAYNANKEAIDLLARTGRGLHPDFSTIFTTGISANVEAVLFKRFSADAGSSFASSWEATIRPRSGGGSGSANPTWNLVKAFPMANGKWITDPTSGYDSTYFWQNRDPRFYATIAYNGCKWKMSGKDSETQWAYDRNMQENNTRPGTGFYNKKASDPLLGKDKTSLGSTTWHEIRYAEVLLNFAECANEIGKPDEAIDQIKKIRARAGIEIGDGLYGIPSSASKTELLEIIMNERQVEFAFENKRYWDLRRRLMFRNDLGPNTPKLNGSYRYGIETRIKSKYLKIAITDKASPFYNWKMVDTAAYYGHININDQAVYNEYFTTTVRVLEEAPYSFNYLPLFDFFAIPSAALQSSDSIKQTVNWFDGSFDPLEE